MATDSDENPNEDVLKEFHKLMLEALRQREKDIIQFVAVLAPALGGFVWLVKELEVYPERVFCKQDQYTFMIGTIGVVFLLAIGAAYTAALGYNFRYITMQLAKLEYRWGVSGSMLKGWPRSSSAFRNRYGKYCIPPDIICVFWSAFLLSIVLVTGAACVLMPVPRILCFVGPAGLVALLYGLTRPCHYGCKMYSLTDPAREHWGTDDNESFNSQTGFIHSTMSLLCCIFGCTWCSRKGGSK
jgi:hypothetical protein